MNIEIMRKVMANGADQRSLDAVMAADTIQDCCKRVMDAIEGQTMDFDYVKRQFELIEKRVARQLRG
jgi:hypothetical protein